MEGVVNQLVPILVTLGAFTMVVLLRRLTHAERLKMIEKGMDPNQHASPKKNSTLKWALIAIGVGIGLLIGNMLSVYTSLNDEVCYFSMTFLFGGAGLFIAHQIDKRQEKEDDINS